MKLRSLASFGALLAVAGANQSVAVEADDILQQVDPFIGTGFHGHTFPGATTPFGMVQLSPDTRTAGWDACGGYYDADTEIWGFSHTHLSGTGIGDYGDVLVMPFTGDIHIGSGTPAQPDYGYRYTFPKAAKAGVVVDLKHSIQNREILTAEIEVLNDREIAGWRHVHGWAENRWIYFHAEFSKPFTAELFVADSLQNGKASVSGQNVKARLNFATTEGETVLVKVGLSHVDRHGAKKNLRAEAPGWDFDGVVKSAAAAWTKHLTQIQVQGGTAEQRTVFATALYHTAICPNVASDVDGRYRGMDQQNHQDANYTNYTVFSLWDTFRAQHPLYTILNPELDQAWIRSLLRKHDEGGILPMWELASNETGCMIGYHSVPVIVDAYTKGLRDFDVQKAMDAIVFSSQYDDQKPIVFTSAGVREKVMPKAKLFNATKGFIPADLERKSVSRALEFAYNDWTIATMARELGRVDVATEYFKRAGYYRQYFDPQTGFMRAKTSGGQWREPFLPTDSNHTQGEYVEGNAWQGTWFVPHDVPGLMALFGGREQFAAKLNELFTTSSALTGSEISSDITGLIGQYAHGNEPSHHIAYLFNWAEQPWRTAEIVHQIMTEFYLPTPAGLIGNEDAGQMSAWFVLSALGIYQVAPGDPHFSLGRPLFDQARVALPDGKVFVVRMKNGAAHHPYVQRVTLNGEPLKTPFITYADIMAGKELVFEMGPEKTVFWKRP
jgi:predicted alpha-1,2-mannosidase